jgi:hypothetical protein
MKKPYLNGQICSCQQLFTNNANRLELCPPPLHLFRYKRRFDSQTYRRRHITGRHHTDAQIDIAR